MNLVLSHLEDYVLTIALNRPDVRNALNPPLMSEVQDELAKAATNDSVRCVILTGTGSAFSAGADLSQLKEMIGASEEVSREDSERYRTFFLSLYNFPRPLIAAVNGPAIAGGCGLATVCDLVVAAENARFGYTEVKIGFIPALVSAFLQTICLEKPMNDLLLTGRIIDADEALALGLVNEVVGRDESLARARELAAVICNNSPEALLRTKAVLRRIRGLPPEKATEIAAEANARARATSDFEEGIRAFLERRDPQWK